MKLQDWPERLTAYVLARMHAPFAWGSNDCVSFANGAHEALTGSRVDVPTWADARGAATALAARGGLVAAVDAVLPRVPVNFLQRGDLVLVDDGTRQALGVYFSGRAWAPGAAGLADLPVPFDGIAWGVGRDG